MKKRAKSHPITLQRIQVPQQGVHRSPWAHNAEHGHRPGWNFSMTSIRDQRCITSAWNGSVERMHGFEVVHTEHDLSRAAGSPTFEEP